MGDREEKAALVRLKICEALVSIIEDLTPDELDKFGDDVSDDVRRDQSWFLSDLAKLVRKVAGRREERAKGRFDGM